MMVVIDFTGGPWAEPEPLHHHFHEQMTFVAEGEILFFCEGEKTEKLRAGSAPFPLLFFFITNRIQNVSRFFILKYG